MINKQIKNMYTEYTSLKVCIEKSCIIKININEALEYCKKHNDLIRKT